VNSHIVVKEHIYDDPFTMVRLEASYLTKSGPVTFSAVGFAKRDRSCDMPNRKVGFEHAFHRAMEKISKKRDKYLKSNNLRLTYNVGYATLDSND
jgi:hypothetical protein